MVARGDLGVEFPPERVPVIQRQILSVARRVRRPVIVATEMLQSMTKTTRPDARRGERRRERGLLAAPTPSCSPAKPPPATTRRSPRAMMSRIAMEAENEPVLRARAVRVARDERRRSDRARRGNTAREIGAQYIVAFTESGLERDDGVASRARRSRSSRSRRTRRRAAAWRSSGASSRARCRRCTTPTRSSTGAPAISWRAASRRPGERVVIVFGAPIGVSGSTNSIRVHVISLNRPAAGRGPSGQVDRFFWRIYPRGTPRYRTSMPRDLRTTGTRTKPIGETRRAGATPADKPRSGAADERLAAHHRSSKKSFAARRRTRAPRSWKKRSSNARPTSSGSATDPRRISEPDVEADFGLDAERERGARRR